MITTEEIAVRVRQLLMESRLKDELTGKIDYERNDYSKEDIIIIPHTVDGEESVRYGQINVNIHVPDIVLKQKNAKAVYRINYSRLIELRAMAIDVLASYYEHGKGYNWTIGRLNPAIKEPKHNEHYLSLALELTIREK